MSEWLDYTGVRPRSGLSEDEEFSLFANLPPLYYADTGELFTGQPKTVTLSDPFTYTAPDGRVLVQQFQADFIVWKDYSIPIEDVKNYLRIDHNADDPTIERLTAAAIQAACTSINRSFEKVPADIELAILKTIAAWYENRGDDYEPPADAQRVYNMYYKNPGL